MLKLTGLRDSDHIVAEMDGWNAVLLNRSRGLVASQLDVLEHCWVKTGIFEFVNRVDALGALLI